MSSAENDYYAQVFNYVMMGVQKDDIYKWETYQSSGAIRPGDYFVSKSQALCRPFVEIVTVGDQNYSGQGYACQRQGRDGWCRLREGNMLSCALEPPDNMLDSMLASASRMADGVHAPSLGAVDASGVPVISNSNIGQAINNIGNAVGGPSMPSVPDSAAIRQKADNAGGWAEDQVPETKDVRGKTSGVVNWIGSFWPF